MYLFDRLFLSYLFCTGVNHQKKKTNEFNLILMKIIAHHSLRDKQCVCKNISSFLLKYFTIKTIYCSKNFYKAINIVSYFFFVMFWSNKNFCVPVIVDFFFQKMIMSGEIPRLKVNELLQFSGASVGIFPSFSLTYI